MKKKEYEQLEHFEKKYWWHIGRRFILNNFLKKWFLFYKTQNFPLIVDFGCGTGGNLKILNKFGKVIGVDNSEIAIDFCRAKNQKVKLINGIDIPFPEKSVDLITALDVLEHIDSDIAILKEFQRILKIKGKVLITVPAYSFIWSEHDEALGHRRRYLASELQTKLNQAGFKILKISYMVSFVFPAILAYRLYRRIFPKNLLKPKTSYIILPVFINQILATIMKIESVLLNNINLPFGCSIIVYAEKK